MASPSACRCHRASPSPPRSAPPSTTTDATLSRRASRSRGPGKPSTRVEHAVGLKFGDKHQKPLLVSVRSGARVSMPGMMDTVPQSRPERRHRRKALSKRLPATPASPGTAIAASSRCMARRRARRRTPPLRGDHREAPSSSAGVKGEDTALNSENWQRKVRSPSYNPSCGMVEIFETRPNRSRWIPAANSSGAPSAPCSAPG